MHGSAALCTARSAATAVTKSYGCCRNLALGKFDEEVDRTRGLRWISEGGRDRMARQRIAITFDEDRSVRWYVESFVFKNVLFAPPDASVDTNSNDTIFCHAHPRCAFNTISRKPSGISRADGIAPTRRVGCCYPAVIASFLRCTVLRLKDDGLERPLRPSPFAF